MRNLVLGVMAGTLVACGGGTEPTVERNDPGTGTLTLKVTADIDAKDVVGGFVTDFEVAIEDAGGNPISGATVTIKNPSLGEITLLETSAGSGEYTAVRNSFPSGDFELNVVRDTDNVQGVILGGPGIHTITAPLADESVPALQSLIVTWNSPSQAKSAELETRDYGPVVIPDTGAAVIPSSETLARSDERIRIYRFNEVGINGGLPGSRLKVEVRQTVEPVIIQ
ncbi:MAG: hypothetical protein IH876_16450 [Gemmatimonadetes bacterium]|nr:hypothetical protein [Gemmatimonadota bacterium]